MAGILLSQVGGAGTLNEAGAQHPSPVTVEVGLMCKLSLPGVSTTTYRWALTKPGGSSSVLSSATSAGPSFLPDIDGGSYSISCFDIDEEEYILDIVTPTPGVGGSGGGGSVVTTLDTYDDVRAATFGTSTPQSVTLIRCRASLDDGGGGMFAFDPDDTTTDDDDGVVLVDADGHRFKRIFSGPVNVRWYGAIGDDVADDTAAIQAAAGAVEDGGAVYFPPGTYRIVKPAGSYPVRAVTFAASAIRIYGEYGKSRVHVVDAGDDFGNPTPPVSSYDAWHLTGDDTILEDLVFYGDLADEDWEVVNSNIYQRSCIWIDANRVKVKRCSFHHLRGHLVHELGAYIANDVIECTVDTCFNGFNVNSPFSKHVNNHLRRANGLESYLDHMVFEGNTFDESNGISIYGDYCTCVGNTIKDCGSAGIILAGSRRTIVANNGVHVVGSGEHAITVVDDVPEGIDPVSEVNVITGNVVVSDTGHGIWLASGAGTIVTGNSATGGNCGLLIDGTADGVLADGNRLSGGVFDLAIQFAESVRIGPSNVLVNDTYTVINGGTLAQAGRTKTVSASPTTIEATYDTVRVTMNGACAITLPSPATVGARKRVTVINASTQLGTTTITASAGSVRGPASLVGPYVSAAYVSDGTDWQFVGGSPQVVESVTTARALRGMPFFYEAEGDIDEFGRFTVAVTTGAVVKWPIDAPEGCSLTGVELVVIGGGNASLPANMPGFNVRVLKLSDNTTDGQGPFSDASINVGQYNAIHSIEASLTPITVDNQDHRHTIEFFGESGANATAGYVIIGIYLTFTTTAIDRGAA